jgi:CHAD domain-containing protein
VRLGRSWAKFRKKSRHLEDLSAGARHKVRIAAKKLRYGMEFMAPLARGGKARGRRGEMLQSFKLLQDALGALNDVRTERQLAPDFVRQGRGVAFAAGRLIGGQEARTAPLLRRAAKAARKLRKKKPFWD